MRSMTATDQEVAQIARRLSDREQARTGAKLPDAHRSLARRVGISPGTLQSLRKGRLKGVRAYIAEALRSALIKELESEIAAHETELAILRLSHRRVDQEQIHEVAESLAALRGVLRGE